MNVLPSAATLASFFIVLTVVAIITFLLSLPTVSQRIFELALQRPQFNDKVWADLSQAWSNIQKSVGYYHYHDLETTDDGTERRRWLGRGARLIRWPWTLLYLITDLALNGSSYTLSLLCRPRRNVHYPQFFTLGKFCTDVLWFLFLPLWITLLFVAAAMWLPIYSIRICRSRVASLFG